MAWVLTKQLQAFRDQMDAAFPHRDRKSDGTIGDAAHQAEKSGHNPDLTANAEYKDGDAKDEVRAIDIDSDTGDPDVSMEDIVQHLLKLARAGKLAFIRYMIFNRRIWAASDGWAQRAYTGASPHTEHLHLSGAYNQTSDELASANYHLEDLVALSDDDKQWLKDNLPYALLGYDPGKGTDGKAKWPGVADPWNPGETQAPGPALGNVLAAVYGGGVDRVDEIKDRLFGMDTKISGLLTTLVALAQGEAAEVPASAQAIADAVLAGLNGRSLEETAAALKAIYGDQAAALGQLLAAA